LDQMQFIVPSPMIRIKGLAKNGRRSMRSLENTGDRRFLVVESDPKDWKFLSDRLKAQFGTEENYKQIKKDEAAAVLWHLAQTAPKFPLVMVVDSAGKSLHGWFYVAGAPEDEVQAFFKRAVARGADKATWTRCQFVRMPGGARDNGKRQSIIYFNPQPSTI